MMVLMSLLLASCGKQTVCPGAARDDYTMVSSDFDDAALHGDHHGMRAVAGAELRQDTLHVRLDRALRDGELLRDLLVRQAAADPAQHLELALRQRVVRGMLRDLNGDFGRDPALARVDGPDRVQQL